MNNIYIISLTDEDLTKIYRKNNINIYYNINTNSKPVLLVNVSDLNINYIKSIFNIDESNSKLYYGTSIKLNSNMNTNENIIYNWDYISINNLLNNLISDITISKIFK